MKHITTTPTRTRKTLGTTAVALVIMTSGILATLVYQSASSSPPTISAVLRRDHDNPPTEDSGETSQLGAPVRPAGDLENEPPRMNAGVTLDDGVLPDGVSMFDDSYPGVANLDPDLLQAVRIAATDAAGDGLEFYVTSGWRSPAYQNQLLQVAIAEYGSEAEAMQWVATADTSAHVSGDAVDLGGSDAAAWLSRYGAGYGLCQIYANEPWHFELRSHAMEQGCPPMYPDPTQDPRMQQ